MCKNGRKINKINFNKFIWIYWKMNIYIYIYIYIYIIFFGGFPVAGMRKKKCEKKTYSGGWNGLLPISSLCESRYSGLYGDTGCAWLGRLGHDTVGLGHDTAEQCCDTVERKAAIRLEARARAAWLTEVGIQSCIVAGGCLVGCDTARGWAARLYRETGATRHRERHDTTLEARDTTPCAAIQCDTVGGRPQHGASARHYTAQCAAWAQWARSLGSGCAPIAPNPVVT